MVPLKSLWSVRYLWGNFFIFRPKLGEILKLEQLSPIEINLKKFNSFFTIELYYQGLFTLRLATQATLVHNCGRVFCMYGPGYKTHCHMFFSLLALLTPWTFNYHLIKTSQSAKRELQVTTLKSPHSCVKCHYLKKIWLGGVVGNFKLKLLG